MKSSCTFWLQGYLFKIYLGCLSTDCPPCVSTGCPAVSVWVTLSLCPSAWVFFSVCSSAHVSLSLSLAVRIFLCSRLSVFIVIRLCMCVSASLKLLGFFFLPKNLSGTQLVKGHKAMAFQRISTRK